MGMQIDADLFLVNGTPLSVTKLVNEIMRDSDEPPIKEEMATLGQNR